MEQVSTETYRKFRAFLKRHDAYEDFMVQFIEQKYRKIILHKNVCFRPNFIKEMNEHFKDDNGNQQLESYGALVFAFECFKWVVGERNVPKNYTKRWCTLLGVKWALYCVKNNIPICKTQELARLLKWWDKNEWIDTTKLSLFEKALIRQILNTN